MNRRVLIASMALLGEPAALAAQSPETGFLNRVATVDGTEHRYQVYVPAEYDPAVRWPVILFLHGAGERGTDGLVQTEVGLGSALRRHVERFPAIIVFPQAPPETLWTDARARLAITALDRTILEFNTDPRRVYLTGLSMGGHGAWHLAYHEPDRFAALVVVCAWVAAGERPGVIPHESASPYDELADRVQHLPTWIFHGDDDDVIPVEESRRMYDALSTREANVQYTELPGVGHNAWDPAYRSEELAEWLLAQRRS